MKALPAADFTNVCMDAAKKPADRRNMPAREGAMEENRFSKKVFWYNYILCFLVVWVHAVNAADTNAALALLAGQPGAWDAKLQNVLANGAAQMAVPGFFMLSAYLFYRNLHSLRGILKKWQSRFFSLFIPYCAWNLLYYLLHVLTGDAPLNTEEFTNAVTMYAYNPVFWYLFQLILLTAAAPLLYVILRDARACAAALVFVPVMIFRQWDIPLLNEDALFYYLLGAAAAVYQRALIEKYAVRGAEKNTITIGLLLWLGAACTSFGMQYALARGYAGAVILLTVLTRAFMASGLWFVMDFSGFSAEIPAWARNTFFIYATHYLVIRAADRGLAPLLAVSAGMRTAVFLLMPVFCTACAWAGAALLKKFLPQEWNILAGGR